ncbi:MAG TPA: hypothetical protein DIC35_03075 [Candidatus Moranbacteria bacterium]|nr:hypothetical protein [Candidatus Moranbacteria bacterium]
MFFGEWMLYAIPFLMFFSAVNVMDTFFIAEEIYKDAYETMIVSSLFKIIGIIIVGAVFFKETLALPLEVIALSVLGGILLSISFLFCSMSLFKYNDMALIHVFWGLSTPVTAVMAWFFLKEDLGIASYLGMAVIIVGAGLLSFSKKSLKCNLGSFSLMMIPLIVFYSLSEVVMKHVEEGLHADFWATFSWVCVGQVIFGLILLAVRYGKVKERKLFQRIANAKNRNLFVISEMFELLGTFFMMLSIAKTPSVTYFAVMDSFLPLMVIILTGTTGSVMIMLGKSKSLSVVFKENHLAGIAAKVAAIIMMAFGVYVMSCSSQDAMNIINNLSRAGQGLFNNVEKVFFIDDLFRFLVGLLG